jgi:hypothetical protein
MNSSTSKTIINLVDSDSDSEGEGKPDVQTPPVLAQDVKVAVVVASHLLRPELQTIIKVRYKVKTFLFCCM